MNPAGYPQAPTVIHMGNLKHVYMTAHGSYPSGAWLGESAQIGVRAGFVATLNAPVKGDIFACEEGGTITPDFGSQAGTNGVLSRTWSARVGPLGSTENMNAAAQIDWAEDMWKFLNAIKAMQSNSFRWTHVKMAAVDPLGKSPVVSSVYTFTTPLVGAVTSSLPPQIAMAVSTRANLVGRRGRGRVYIPAIGATMIDASGVLAASPQTTGRNSLKTLIDDIQAQPGFTQHLPIVFVGSADSATVVRPVEVRTGNRADTIQSRRRQVAETYTTTAL